MEQNLQKRVNSYKTNIWRSAQDHKEYARITFFIKKLHEKTGLTKNGVMCALFTAGLEVESDFTKFIPAIEKEWENSEECKRFGK